MDLPGCDVASSCSLIVLQQCKRLKALLPRQQSCWNKPCTADVRSQQASHCSMPSAANQQQTARMCQEL
jgi:hypothetical protein